MMTVSASFAGCSDCILHHHMNGGNSHIWKAEMYLLNSLGLRPV